MKPHEERVVKEKQELEVKINKLQEFFNFPTFTTLPVEEQSRLKRQSDVMVEYAKILSERIANFPI